MVHVKGATLILRNLQTRILYLPADRVPGMVPNPSNALNVRARVGRSSQHRYVATFIHFPINLIHYFRSPPTAWVPQEQHVQSVRVTVRS